MGVARRFNKPRKYTNLVNLLVNMRLLATLIFVNMAVAFVHLGQQQCENRQFEPRIHLNDVSNDELTNYRLPRDLIEEIVTGFAAREYGNLTERGHATPSDMQVGKILPIWDINFHQYQM